MQDPRWQIIVYPKSAPEEVLAEWSSPAKWEGWTVGVDGREYKVVSQQIRVREQVLFVEPA